MILIIIYLSANYWKNKEALGVSRSKNNSNYRRDEIQRLSLSMSKEKVDLEKKLIKDINLYFIII